MVRKKLREKSSKQKVAVEKENTATAVTKRLSRGQKKRLATKLHVMNKKATTLGAHVKLDVIEKGIQAHLQKLEDSLEDETKKAHSANMNAKKMKGAPKTQQMQNKMLFLEMQRYHNVVLNERVKDDPYEAVRQYLQEKTNA